MPIYRLDGREPQLPKSGKFWIAPDAHVIGDVIIEEDVSIWFGTVIRGDGESIFIGKGSNVQDQCMIHTDPGFPVKVSSGCTIGHQAILHGATIGENSLVGMGATLLNGAKIGINSLVGANALVTEGKSFDDNSLIVGAPARAVRTIGTGAVKALKQSALHYVENHRLFAEKLERID